MYVMKSRMRFLERLLLPTASYFTERGGGTVLSKQNRNSNTRERERDRVLRTIANTQLHEARKWD